MKNTNLVTYTLSSGITMTANRDLVNRIRREEADRIREAVFGKAGAK